jgi:hypothetical protein
MASVSRVMEKGKVGERGEEGSAVSDAEGDEELGASVRRGRAWTVRQVRAWLKVGERGRGGSRL